MTIVQIGPIVAGMGTAPTLHYMFYSVIEVACNLFIVWYAWQWRNSSTVATKQEIRGSEAVALAAETAI